jgi:hypothetical protein
MRPVAQDFGPEHQMTGEIMVGLPGEFTEGLGERSNAQLEVQLLWPSFGPAKELRHKPVKAPPQGQRGARDLAGAHRARPARGGSQDAPVVGPLSLEQI